MPFSQRRDHSRLLPADPRTRAIATDLYERVAGMPIISPHGHVPPQLLLDDAPFTDAAELFVQKDHYVTRLLHSAGISLESLGVGGAQADPREVWRAFASNWHLFAGTASGYWLSEELSAFFGVTVDLSADNADEVFDLVARHLATDEFRPRALFRSFNLEVLATTDDPLSDLAAHRSLRDLELGGRVIPTFRPDAYLDPEIASFVERVEALLRATGEQPSFAGYLAALQSRREYFIANGAVSTDHGVLEPLTIDLDAAVAEPLFQAALSGTIDADQARTFRAHMLFQMARMSVEDGLVMTVHPGVLRNHSTPTYKRFGADAGHDIPVATTFTQGMRPLLERFGLEPNLHLVLFTIDESSFSRELAPLAGFYPSVFVGAPWWFLDAPDSIARFRAATVETAGFYKSSGFIDDTRAFLSIPARHDTARRVDSAVLARLVAEERISLARAERIADDLVGAIPRKVFKL
ncbi:MAG: glucuronate isomerase [Rhodoglobus sp.]